MTYDNLLDPKALQNLVKDIGVEETRRFMEALDSDLQKRITNLRDALSRQAYAELASEAHAMRSSAQISGAYKLVQMLTKLELQAKTEDLKALELAQEAITIADLTRFAFLDVKLSD